MFQTTNQIYTYVMTERRLMGFESDQTLQFVRWVLHSALVSCLHRCLVIAGRVPKETHCDMSPSHVFKTCWNSSTLCPSLKLFLFLNQHAVKLTEVNTSHDPNDPNAPNPPGLAPGNNSNSETRSQPPWCDSTGNGTCQVWKRHGSAGRDGGEGVRAGGDFLGLN